MFRYINMPKLVAFYLREFSVKPIGEPTDLYRFVFCLCLPFFSQTFRRARLIALGIAECTNSGVQIVKLLTKITGANISIVGLDAEYSASFDGTDMLPEFPYDNSLGNDSAIVPYKPAINAGIMYVSLNGFSQTQFEAYLKLLVPFYVQIKIEYL